MSCLEVVMCQYEITVNTRDNSHTAACVRVNIDEVWPISASELLFLLLLHCDLYIPHSNSIAPCRVFAEATSAPHQRHCLMGIERKAVREHYRVRHF